MNLPRALALAPVAFVMLGLGISLYLMGQSQESSCNPWLTGCIGISELGVPDPISFVYRAGLLPGAMLLAFWWYAVRSWIAEVEPGVANDYSAWLTALGFTAAACLMIAVSVLRPEVDQLPWAVHCVFMAGFVVIQLYLQARLGQRQWGWRRDGILNTVSLWLRAPLVVVQLVLVAVLLIGWIAGTPELAKMAGWWLATLIMLFVLISYLDWGAYHLTLDDEPEADPVSADQPTD